MLTDVRFCGYFEKMNIICTYVVKVIYRFLENILGLRGLAPLPLKKCTTDVVLKIENQQGVKNLDEIIACSQGLMVARSTIACIVYIQYNIKKLTILFCPRKFLYSLFSERFKSNSHDGYNFEDQTKQFD